MRSRLALAIGLFGLLDGAFWLRVWWRVLNSPGDDNPVGMVAFALVLLALVPASLLGLWAAALRPRRHPFWIAGGLLASAPMLLATLVALELWCRV